MIGQIRSVRYVEFMENPGRSAKAEIRDIISCLMGDGISAGGQEHLGSRTAAVGKVYILFDNYSHI